jgi:hypothetical protein
MSPHYKYYHYSTLCTLSGVNQYGLFNKCEELLFNNQRREACSQHDTVAGEWHAATVFLVLGLILLFVAIVYTGRAAIQSHYMDYARWLAFGAGWRIPHALLRRYFILIFEPECMQCVVLLVYSFLLPFCVAIFFSMASLIFPLGFDQEFIGGQVRGS